MSERTESVIAIFAALFVLFTAMLDPRISAALAITLLLAVAGYKLRQSRAQAGGPRRSHRKDQPP